MIIKESTWKKLKITGVKPDVPVHLVCFDNGLLTAKSNLPVKFFISFIEIDIAGDVVLFIKKMIGLIYITCGVPLLTSKNFASLSLDTKLIFPPTSNLALFFNGFT